MTDYDARVIEAIGSLPRLLRSRMFLLPAVAALLPAAVVHFLDVWPLFAAFLIVLGLYGRSLRLSGLLCWVAVSTTVFLYYLFPDPGHFIETILRAPARASGTIPSAEQVISSIPASIGGKILWSAIYGLRVGFVVGLGLGMVGRKVWGHPPGFDHLLEE